MIRYGGADDRLDHELLLSVYHHDAVADHGCDVGNPEQFAECATSMHAETQPNNHHVVTNHVCDLDGEIAHSGTYWMYVGINRKGDTAPATAKAASELRAIYGGLFLGWAAMVFMGLRPSLPPTGRCCAWS